MTGYRSTNAALLLQPKDPKYIADGTEKAIEVVLKDLHGGKVIQADVVPGGFELTVGVESSGKVYEICIDKDLKVTLRQERPNQCPHWVERDIYRAKRNM